MFGPLGAPEVLIVLIVWAAPIAILVYVANARGRSPWFGAFGILGLIGLVVGLLVLIAVPPRGNRA